MAQCNRLLRWKQSMDTKPQSSALVNGVCEMLKWLRWPAYLVSSESWASERRERLRDEMGGGRRGGGGGDYKNDKWLNLRWTSSLTSQFGQGGREREGGTGGGGGGGENYYMTLYTERDIYNYGVQVHSTKMPNWASNMLWEQRL